MAVSQWSFDDEASFKRPAHVAHAWAGRDLEEEVSTILAMLFQMWFTAC